MNKPKQNERIFARQIAFAAAFILPASKLLEAPSLLSAYAKGDVLMPALLHFLVQALVLLGILYALSLSKKTLSQRLEEKLGKGIFLLYILYALYFLFSAAIKSIFSPNQTERTEVRQVISWSEKSG